MYRGSRRSTRIMRLHARCQGAQFLTCHRYKAQQTLRSPTIPKTCFLLLLSGHVGKKQFCRGGMHLPTKQAHLMVPAPALASRRPRLGACHLTSPVSYQGTLGKHSRRMPVASRISGVAVFGMLAMSILESRFMPCLWWLLSWFTGLGVR